MQVLDYGGVIGGLAQCLAKRVKPKKGYRLAFEALKRANESCTVRSPSDGKKSIPARLFSRRHNFSVYFRLYGVLRSLAAIHPLFFVKFSVR